MMNTFTFTDQRPVRKLRCTKGHEWTQQQGSDTLTVQLNEQDPSEPFCLRCLRDWMRLHVGTVEEVPQEDIPQPEYVPQIGRGEET